MGTQQQNKIQIQIQNTNTKSGPDDPRISGVTASSFTRQHTTTKQNTNTNTKYKYKKWPRRSPDIWCHRLFVHTATHTNKTKYKYKYKIQIQKVAQTIPGYLVSPPLRSHGNTQHTTHFRSNWYN